MTTEMFKKLNLDDKTKIIKLSLEMKQKLEQKDSRPRKDKTLST